MNINDLRNDLADKMIGRDLLVNTNRALLLLVDGSLDDQNIIDFKTIVLKLLANGWRRLA